MTESTARTEVPPEMVSPGTQAGKGARSPRRIEEKADQQWGRGHDLPPACGSVSEDKLRAAYMSGHRNGHLRGTLEGLMLGGVCGIVAVVILILNT